MFAVAIAAGDIIKYQSFVYGSFVWGIHVRYNNIQYAQVLRVKVTSKKLSLVTNMLDVRMHSFIDDVPNDNKKGK